MLLLLAMTPVPSVEAGREKAVQIRKERKKAAVDVC